MFAKYRGVLVIYEEVPPIAICGSSGIHLKLVALVVH